MHLNGVIKTTYPGVEGFLRNISLFCGADISGKAHIDRHVSFPHRGIGVIIHPNAEIGEGCIISAKAGISNPGRMSES